MSVIQKKESFSLLEVLIFVTILSMFFVTAAAVVTAMVRNLKFEEHKLIASHYARELEEWLRTEKEIDWNAFTQKSTTTYCFTTLTWGSILPCSYNLDGIYARSAALQALPAGPVYKDRVTATITVSWAELGGTIRNVITQTEFRVLE